MRGKIIGTVILFVLVISSVLLMGCDIEQVDGNIPTRIDYKVINVHGIDKYQSIYTQEPTIINIDGIDLKVSIQDRSMIKEINVNGIDIIVEVPQGSNFVVDDSGIRTQIVYR